MMQLAASRFVPFYGNGPYCYSNATSMLLASIGEDSSPSEVEAYTGVGLGAFLLPTPKPGVNLLFFSSIANPPDKGVSRALRLLGLDFKETATEDAMKPPYDQLRSDLEESPAVLGPLDMGYLPYNPAHNRMAGSDHFVLAYAMDDGEVSIHDPEGFPSVHLPFRQLEMAWKAEKIGYRRGYYRYWTGLKRVRHPSADELYHSTRKAFREVYVESEKIAKADKWTIDGDAILTEAGDVKKDKVNPGKRGFMIYFALKLGARRALDFARFFESRDQHLAELKRKQADLFGQAQSSAVERKWVRVAESLTALASAEKEFKDSIMSA